MNDVNHFAKPKQITQYMLRVALLSKYVRMGASSRLRSLQFLPLLRDDGIIVEAFPLFDERYLSALYLRRRRKPLDVLRNYLHRIVAIRCAKKFDVLWIEKELLPYVPRSIERILQPSGVPVLVDLDDAVFHNYDLSSSAIVRYLLGSKIDRVMEDADCVSVGNNYLAKRAVIAGAKWVENRPTAVDVSRYSPKKVLAPNIYSLPLVIGWIGSPSTERYVHMLVAILRELCCYVAAKLVLVGASPSIIDKMAGLNVEVLPWEESSEASRIAAFDIGIMPLPNEPWEKGKCGYKLIQYMACGLPVVASPVGLNQEIVEQGVTGFLAEDDASWMSALKSLALDPELRYRMGSAGRRKVEIQYSMQAQAAQIATILKELASLGGGGENALCAE